MAEVKSQQKKRLILTLFLVSFLGVFIFIHPAHAWWETVASGLGSLAATVADKLASMMLFIFGGLIRGLMSLIGELVLSITDILIKVAQYNDFINSQAVTTGWVVVRDVANMFFIIILLVIAVTTILNLESFSYKKALPKLLLMAVFINFSKTICGIIIDFGQVVMLTFVNAFKAAAGANFVQAFGLDQVMSFAAGVTTYDDAALMGAMILGLIVLLVALATMTTLLVVLVARIIVLWILIILSPFAFLLAASPFGSEYSKEWWKQFTNYVVSGPILAFFIWLSLIVAGGGMGNTQIGVTTISTEGSTSVTAAALGTVEKLSSVIVAAAMLLIGLGATKKLQVAGSGMAGKVLDYTSKKPLEWAKGARKWGKEKAGAAWSRGTGAVSDYTYAKTGVALPFSERRKKSREQRQKNIHTMREAEGMAKTAERMAGGRAYWASLVDPRAAGKLSTWEMIKATAGGENAQAKVRRASNSMLGAAVSDMRSVDPLQAKELEIETKAAMGDKQVAPQIAERDALEQIRMTYENGEKGAADKIRDVSRKIDDLKREEEGLDTLYGQTNDGIISDRAGQRLAAEQKQAQKEGRTIPASRMRELFNEEKGKALRQAMTRAGKGATQEKVDQEYEAVLREPILKRKEQVAKERQGLEASQPRLEKEHKNLADAAERVGKEIGDINLRLSDPEKARDDAMKRRERAVERGDNDEVKKIDVELRKIDQVSFKFDADGAKERWSKMTYGAKMDAAKKDAEGFSEARLAKKLAAALKDGKITKADFDDFTKIWRDQGVKAADEEFEERQKAAAAAAAPATPAKP